MDENKDKEYLYWSNGLFLGIAGSVLGSFFVTSFFIIKSKFRCSWESIPIFESVVLIFTFVLLLLIYLKYAGNASKIIEKNTKQIALNNHLEKNRLQRAMALLKKDPSLNLDLSKAMDIILRKKADPSAFLTQYKECKEIVYDNSGYTLNTFTNSNEYGDLLIIERFINHDYSGPLDDAFWGGFENHAIGTGDLFGSARGSDTVSLLLYCLSFKAINKPIRNFSNDDEDSDLIEEERLRYLANLLIGNPNIRNDTKELLKEILRQNPS